MYDVFGRCEHHDKKHICPGWIALGLASGDRAIEFPDINRIKLGHA